MAWVAHWKLTAAMAAFYAVVAALIVYFAGDAALAAPALLVLFSLVLLAGNIYIGRKDRVQGNDRGPGAGGRGPGERADAVRPRHPAPGTRHPDPYPGRR